MNGRTYYKIKGNEKVLNPQECLPDEVNLHILSFLGHSDNHQMQLANKYWRKQAIEVHYNRRIKKQVQFLENSEVWKILPAIANNQDISEYFKKDFLLPKQEERFREGINFNDIVKKLLTRDNSRTLSRLNSGDYGKKIFFLTSFDSGKYEYGYDNDAIAILKVIDKYNKKNHTSLESFLKFPVELQQQQNKFFLDFSAFVEELALVRFMFQIWLKEEDDKKEATIETIIDIMVANPELSRNMPMSFVIKRGLMMHLLERLVISAENGTDEKEVAIQRWLKQLTIFDWVLFFLKDFELQIFQNALPYLPLMDKNQENLEPLFNLEAVTNPHLRDRTSKMADELLTLDFITNDFDFVIELIKFSSSEEKLEIILHENPNIIRKINLEKSIKLLQTCPEKKALVLLRNKDFLNRFNLEDLLKILTRTNIPFCMDGQAFYDRLNIEDKIIRSSFLYEILKNTIHLKNKMHYGVNQELPRIFGMLEINDLFKLAKNNPSFVHSIILTPSIVLKLNSSQLLTVACSGRVSTVFIITSKYLHLFNNSDLKIFLGKFGRLLEDRKEIWKENVVPELELRKQQEKASEVSKASQEVLDLPPEIAIPNASQEGFNNENAALFRQAYDKQQRQSKIRVGLIVLSSILLTPLSLAVSIPLWFRAKSKDKELPLQTVKTTDEEFKFVKEQRASFRGTDTKIKDPEKPSKILISQKRSKRIYVMDNAQAKRFRLFAKTSLDELNNKKDDVINDLSNSKADSKLIMQKQRPARPL